MDFLIPSYRRDPNQKIEALYSGVASGSQTVSTLVRPSMDGNRMEAVRSYGPGLKRGAGGRIAILVLGGMETTLDEMEYILEAKRQKKFVPRNRPGDIVAMCRLVAERRNAQVKKWRKNPSEAPRRRRVRLHLPVGYRFVGTNEPGLEFLAKV